MRQFANYYSPATLALVDQFTSSTDQATQQQALEAIVASQEADRARLLIALLHYSMWRHNTIALLRAIGGTSERRGVEFLIRFVRQQDDLPLAAEAVLALGSAGSHLAGEFLLSIVKDENHGLRREAIAGLAAMPHFPCDALLATIIKGADDNPNLQSAAIVALGRRCARSALPCILDKLHSKHESVANACLLAIGHLADANTIGEILQSANTHRNLLLSELALYVEDKVHLRAQDNIDDMVVSALTNTQRGWHTSFRIIKEYPPEKIWEVFELLRDDISPNNECLIRAATFCPERCAEDFAFLQRQQNRIDVSCAANLLRLCLDWLNENVFLQFRPEYACELLKCVRWPALLDLEPVLFTAADDTQKLNFADALIAQNFMTGNANEAHCEWLYKQYKIANSQPLAGRMMRGLAQLSYTKRNFSNDLRDALNSPDNSGAYYCLGLIPRAVSERVLIERLDTVIKREHQQEIANSLYRLSELGTLENPSVIARLQQPSPVTLDMDILKILVFNRVSGFDGFISKMLQTEDLAKQLLAVAAIATNASKDLCKQLFPFLHSASAQLRARALHSLCVKGNAKQHAELFSWFHQYAFNSETAHKILRCLTPKESESYLAVVRQLQAFIEIPAGPFVDDQLMQELISLCDTLQVHYCKAEDISNDQTPQDLHQQDEALTREIGGFAHYNESVRTILRNAELTWQHKELFDDNVDKSTMLVQYTKSADLLLQEHIGEKLFHQRNDSLLLAMQNRIMALGIEDKNIPPLTLLKLLAVEENFTTADFPSHKLATLTSAIMNGKIMQERYRQIDGLRAWAVILLVFGRTFSSCGTEYESILPNDAMSKADSKTINSVAARMNYLQELRNRAAHHGIIVDYRQMTKIRHDSIAMFNELNDIFQV